MHDMHGACSVIYYFACSLHLSALFRILITTKIYITTNNQLILCKCKKDSKTRKFFKK